MKNYNIILIEKQQKISAWSSGKIDQNEYLTYEEILPSDQRKVTEETTFTYSLLEKTLEKQTKTIEDQSKKQITEIEDHAKQLVLSNKLIKLKRILISTEMPYHLKNKINV